MFRKCYLFLHTNIIKTHTVNQLYVTCFDGWMDGQICGGVWSFMYIVKESKVCTENKFNSK